MLRIKIPAVEYYDERKQEFFSIKEQTLRLEHSLASLSKWESKWCKPFYSRSDKTNEEIMDYIRCMAIDEDVSPECYLHLTTSNIDEIMAYINAPMTATTFRDDKTNKSSREIVTAELIYHWMIELGIPFECQYWHLNKLLTLVKVRNIKLQPPKKMSKRDIMSRNAALNAARRQKLNTKG